MDTGFSRLVRFALRAWRMAVLARVRFICADRAMSGAAAHCAGSATTRPFLGPEPQRHFIDILLEPGFFLNTFRVSVMNSCALICCPNLYLMLLRFGNDRKHIRCSDRSFHHCSHARNVLGGGSDCMLFFCIPIPLSYHPC